MRGWRGDGCIEGDRKDGSISIIIIIITIATEKTIIKNQDKEETVVRTFII